MFLIIVIHNLRKPTLQSIVLTLWLQFNKCKAKFDISAFLFLRPKTWFLCVKILFVKVYSFIWINIVTFTAIVYKNSRITKFIIFSILGRLSKSYELLPNQISLNNYQPLKYNFHYNTNIYLLFIICGFLLHIFYLIPHFVLYFSLCSISYLINDRL